MFHSIRGLRLGITCSGMLVACSCQGAVGNDLADTFQRRCAVCSHPAWIADLAFRLDAENTGAYQQQKLM